MTKKEWDPMFLPRLDGPCEECLSTRAERNSMWILIYCEHRQSAASMLVGPDGKLIPMWRIFTPIGREDFEVIRETMLLELKRLKTTLTGKKEPDEK